MWIEAHHPVGSKFAYHVEFVAPVDAASDYRVGLYEQMYETLLRGPHVEYLETTLQQTQMSMHREAA